MNMEINSFFEMEDVFHLPGMVDVADEVPLHRDAEKALIDCLNSLGRVDLPWMAENSGLSAGELTAALKGAIFQDPEHYECHRSEEEGWLLRPQYISGNLKEKLEAAKCLNTRFSGRFQSNIEALRKAMPDRVSFADIGIGLGSSWVPAHFYAEFAWRVLELYEKPTVTFSAKLGQWRVVAPASARYALHNIYTYGTERMNALKIMEHTLNASAVKVFDQVTRLDLKSGVAYILNKNETLAAQEKQEALQRAFQEWVGKDPGRVRLLEEIYYSTFASVVSGRYDGGFLKLPDLNPDFKPYPHQKNAVARMILDQDVLLNHAVGSGKTNTLVIGLHER